MIIYSQRKTNSKWLNFTVLFLLFSFIFPLQNLFAHVGQGISSDDSYWAKLAENYSPYVIPSNRASQSLQENHFTTDGSWGEVIEWPIVSVSAANLPDGRIITFSSFDRDRFTGGKGKEYTYAVIWDPKTKNISEANHPSHDLFAAHLTLLEDGRLIINGGNNRVPTTSFFDYKTDQWVKGASMNRGRWYPTSVALPNGAVFTALGTGGGKHPELWQEDSGWKLLTGINLQTAILDFNHYEREWWPYFYVDPRGKVFHAGPTPKMHSIDTEGLGTIAQVGPELHDWYPKHGISVMYDKGKILVAGGAISGSDLRSTNKAMIIDINDSSPTVTSIAPMRYARKFHNGIILPNGEVLVVGGNTTGIKFNDAGTVLPAEIWSPITKKWRTVASMSIPRNYHSVALLLNTGKVFSSGSGLCGNCPSNHSNSQIFSPPYLYDKNGNLTSRPIISNAPNSIKHGQTLSLDSSNDISRFTFIKMSSTTHAINTDLRFLEIPYTTDGNGIYNLTFYSNRNILTPGYWMLFAIDSKGTPSIAHTIQVKTIGTPTIIQPQDQFHIVGSNVSLKINATDPNGNNLYFSANNLPQGLSIDPTSGVISGIFSLEETRTVTITVDNGETKNASYFKWQVYPRGQLAGVSYEYYLSNGVNWNHIPDFTQAELVENGVIKRIKLPSVQNNYMQGNYALRLSSRISIDTTGNYTFFLNSKNGSTLWIDGRLIIDNDGIHALKEEQASILLEKGEHDLIVTYFNNDPQGKLTLQYQSHLITKKNIPNQSLIQNPLMNVAPQILSKFKTQTHNINSSIDLNIIATDANNDPLHYSASRLPSGLQIDSSTGQIHGKVLSIGEYNSTINVSDNQNKTSSTDLKWIVTGPLTITPFRIRARPTGYKHIYTAITNGGINNQYKWDFGDESTPTGYTSSTSIEHVFNKPGRFTVTVSIKSEDLNGDTQTIIEQFIQPIFIKPTTNSFRPAISMSIIYDHNSTKVDRIWNVNPDNNSVSVFNALLFSKIAEIPVGKQPRSLAKNLFSGYIWVVNKDSSTISIINPDSLGIVSTIQLPNASQPFGIVFSPADHYAYVTLEATNKLIQIDTNTKKITKRLNVGSYPRHISIDSDGKRLYISRYITPFLPGEDTLNPITEKDAKHYGGELIVVDAEKFIIKNTIILKHSERVDSARSARGIPNYLGTVALSPDGLSAWIPSKQDNIKRGKLRDGKPLTHDTVIRSISSRIDLVNEVEQTQKRVDHDNAGIASAAIYGRYGNLVFVALEGSQEIEVIDAFASEPIFRFSTGGHAPQGLALSPDGLTLYVHNFMERTATVFNLEELVIRGKNQVSLITTLYLVEDELLAKDILKGKQLFYDSKDARLAKEQYSSCAQCHNEGATDGRVWDSSNFGEGLRNTISLIGHGEKNGLLHWSGNFDEVHDFEVQIRSLSGGEGLLSNHDFEATKNTLGPKKEGLSIDMDNLAKYVRSLNKIPDSPYKNIDGSLTSNAQKGARIFLEKGCNDCHSGNFFTDSAENNLHDIGTIKPSSGKRLGDTLTGINTPTLQGLWMTAPYLHDGSASTLQEAIKAMRDKANQQIQTTAEERNLLADYLIQIDSKTKQPKVDNEPSKSKGGSFPLASLLLLLFLALLRIVFIYKKVALKKIYF